MLDAKTCFSLKSALFQNQAMKKQILLAVAGLTIACASSTHAQIIFDDFNVDEGHFGFSPSFAGQSVGEAASSTIDQVTTDNPFEGAGHQKLVLNSDGSTTPLRIRHVSGSPTTTANAANPAANIPFTTTGGSDGFIGYYIRTTVAGLETQLNLDSPANNAAGMYGSAPVTLIADGLWHLYEFSLDAPIWGSVPGITTKTPGVLPDNTYTIDSIYFRDPRPSPTATPSPSGEYFLDFVALNPNGSVADLVPIPEPSTYAMIFGVLALGGAMIHRRRSAKA